MASENSFSPTPDEARSSLEEIDRIMTQTRKTIGAGRAGPMIILWGAIWVVGFAGAQYFPDSVSHLWTGLDIVGVAGSLLLGPWFRRSPVKTSGQWRTGVAWLVLFIYASLWISLLCPWELLHRVGSTLVVPVMNRRIAAFISTIPMFGYVIMGLWLDRFFIWLGALVTVATVIGFYFAGNQFYLWMAITGGGSLIVGGVFIRKFWR